MTNQIKEILGNINDKWKDYYVQDIVSGDDLKQLLDYIINLQEKLDKKEAVLMCAKFKIKALEELITNESAY